METISTIIIEDEPLAREQLKNYLVNFPEITLLAECENGFDGAKCIRQFKPDIIFLDIQMPKLDGFEMIEILEDLPIIIFSTAYDEFALKAFELNAIDYLLKPYSRQRFAQAIQKAKEKLKIQNSNPLVIKDLARKAVENNFPLDRLIIRDSGNLILLQAADVLYIEAADDYVIIYTEKKRYMHQKTLSWYESALNTSFVRIHRSFILNISMVSKIEPYGKDTFVAVLKNHSSKVPISRTGHKTLMDALGKV